MSYNYCLIDDQTRLIIGYCNEIDNLDSSIVFEDVDKYGDKENINKLILKKFIFCEEFKDYVKKKKASLNRLILINIMNENNVKIGNIYFVVTDEKKYYKLGFPLNDENFELKGYFNDLFLKTDLEVWRKWRTQFPNTINQWADLDTDGRRAWLRCVLTHHSAKNEGLRIYEGPKKVYYLDGQFVTDYPSFFCAIGEAINGPCGYFGTNFANLDDCIFGGCYGALRPFTIIWNHSDVAIKNLTLEVWQDQINYEKNENNFALVEGPTGFEKADEPLMQHILKFFEEEGIKVVLYFEMAQISKTLEKTNEKA